MTSRELTFSMIDLAGYTALTETHGDLHAADLAEQFADLARACLADGDRLIKTIGDAVLLASSTPKAGIELTQRILEALGRLDDVPLTRTGIHHGQAIERAGDFFGTAVNVAARVADHAGVGQVVATSQVAEAARNLGSRVSSVGAAQFKNLAEPYELFELHLCSERAEGSVDPVCRMWVERSRAIGPVNHGDDAYWFCSTACADRFRQQPKQFSTR